MCNQLEFDKVFGVACELSKGRKSDLYNAVHKEFQYRESVFDSAIKKLGSLGFVETDTPYTGDTQFHVTEKGKKSFEVFYNK